MFLLRSVFAIIFLVQYAFFLDCLKILLDRLHEPGSTHFITYTFTFSIMSRPWGLAESISHCYNIVQLLASFAVAFLLSSIGTWVTLVVSAALDCKVISSNLIAKTGLRESKVHENLNNLKRTFCTTNSTIKSSYRYELRHF